MIKLIHKTSGITESTTNNMSKFGHCTLALVMKQYYGLYYQAQIKIKIGLKLANPII